MVHFGVDVTAVAALCYWCPKAFTGQQSLGNSLAGLLRPGLCLVAGVAVILLGFFLALWVTSPSLAAALTFLRGEALEVEPSVVDLGRGPQGETRDFSVIIRNPTDRPITVLGGEFSCRCMTTEDLPLCVPAGESRLFTFQFQFLGKGGAFQYPVVLYTDDRTHTKVLCRVAGKVVEPSDRRGG
jgi:hypothetical protein